MSADPGIKMPDLPEDTSLTGAEYLIGYEPGAVGGAALRARLSAIGAYVNALLLASPPPSASETLAGILAVVGDSPREWRIASAQTAADTLVALGVWDKDEVPTLPDDAVLPIKSGDTVGTVALGALLALAAELAATGALNLSNLPSALTLADDDKFLVQQGDVAKNVTFALLRQEIAKLAMSVTALDQQLPLAPSHETLAVNPDDAIPKKTTFADVSDLTLGRFGAYVAGRIPMADVQASDMFPVVRGTVTQRMYYSIAKADIAAMVAIMIEEALAQTGISGTAFQPYPSINDFPAIGVVGVLYYAVDTGLLYRWVGEDGVGYAEVTTSSVTEGVPAEFVPPTVLTGDPVSGYTRALASNVSTAMVAGVVYDVGKMGTTPNAIYVCNGSVFLPEDVGKAMYLSPDTPGGLTAIAPSQPGQFQVEVLRVVSVNSFRLTLGAAYPI